MIKMILVVEKQQIFFPSRFGVESRGGGFEYLSSISVENVALDAATKVSLLDEFLLIKKKE